MSWDVDYKGIEGIVRGNGSQPPFGRRIVDGRRNSSSIEYLAV
jgi:hypothetical protein